MSVGVRVVRVMLVKVLAILLAGLALSNVLTRCELDLARQQLADQAAARARIERDLAEAEARAADLKRWLSEPIDGVSRNDFEKPGCRP